ncbi:helix-turn-helix domain-containing protein [Streptomyces sp. NPDC054784]
MGNRQFAETLIRIRMRSGITQQQLADLSTVSSRAIRNLEKGHVRNPRKETVKLLADALRMDGVTRNHLLKLAEEEDSEECRSGSTCPVGEGERPDFPVLSAHFLRPPDGPVADDAEKRSPHVCEEPRRSTRGKDPGYEYKTVALPSGAAGRELAATVLNREARDGWRLAAVESGIAFLERVIFHEQEKQVGPVDDVLPTERD